jgi:hypothetical protein
MLDMQEYNMTRIIGALEGFLLEHDRLGSATLITTLVKMNMFRNHCLPQSHEVVATDVLGDGNCLCRALAVSSGMAQDQYHFIKSSIADEMKNYSAFYQRLCGFDYDNDLRIAETNFCFMGQIHMLAYANAFPAIVALHSQTTIGAGGEFNAAGNEYTFLPFRHNLSPAKVSQFGVIHIAWGSPLVAIHFISLQNINYVPEDLYCKPELAPLISHLKTYRIKKKGHPLRRLLCVTVQRMLSSGVIYSIQMHRKWKSVDSKRPRK